MPEGQKLKMISQPGIESLSHCPHSGNLGLNVLKTKRKLRHYGRQNCDGNEAVPAIIYDISVLDTYCIFIFLLSKSRYCLFLFNIFDKENFWSVTLNI